MILDVSVSSLYYSSKREAIDLALKTQIEGVLNENPSYGHKRIALHLKLNKKKILRVMHKYHIRPYRRRRKRLVKKEDLKKAETCFKNLIEKLPVKYPNQVWASDFTYIKYRQRFIYLATILDMYTRKIVGFHISGRHDNNLILSALENALLHHSKPSILHSDQGSEYDSNVYYELCKTIGIQISMSRKSSPWENGFQESFYSHFKVELADPERFSTLTDLCIAIGNQIYYYNNERIHSKLKMPPQLFSENHYKFMGT